MADDVDTPVPLTPPEGSAFIPCFLDEVEAATPLEPDHLGLLYPGCVNSLAGEPGSGKSWIAVALCESVLGRGGSVVVLDYEDTPRTWAARFRALGVGEDTLVGALHLRPFGAPSESDIAWLARFVSQFPDVLCVIDSVPEALALTGLDEDRSGEVSRWHQQVPRPIARAGATVLLIDHVTKGAKERGRWARGSGAKLAVVDGVALGLEIVEPFSRQRGGRASITVAKDRHGSIGGVGETVADVVFSVGGGSMCKIRVDRQEPHVHGTTPDMLDRPLYKDDVG